MSACAGFTPTRSTSGADVWCMSCSRSRPAYRRAWRWSDGRCRWHAITPDRERQKRSVLDELGIAIGIGPMPT